ncbi:MAG: TIGR03808 family TAT-translocated repetitive protein [Pseudomonadota bacterium]
MDRRAFLSGAATTAAASLTVPAAPALAAGATAEADARAFGLKPNARTLQTAALQRAIDRSSALGRPLHLPPGTYWTGSLTLRDRTSIIGTSGFTQLNLAGDATVFSANRISSLRLAGLIIDGTGARGSTGDRAAALIALSSIEQLSLDRLMVRNGPANGIRLERCAGGVTNSSFEGFGEAALFLNASRGMRVAANRVSRCANNGILVWQPADGPDGTLVTGNRISGIRSAAGGSGQNGNGVNVYRAHNVMVSGNHITDCAYSAVRGNAASNLQIIANQAHRIGEVALYAEFGFQGAVIASNIVDQAASGISVTNFNVGGRLAVVHGNLVRNLKRREHERVDKRGNGIAVEADAAMTGNTVEGAPTAGIVIGWGRHMRNVAATGNVVTKCGVGIMVTGNMAAGRALIANNIIADAKAGAVRRMARGKLYGPDLTTTPPTDRLTVKSNVVDAG